MYSSMPSPATAGPGGPGPRRNSRAGLITILACAGALCCAMALLIAGGLIHLVVQRGAEPPIATSPLEADGFSTVVPSAWSEGESLDDLVFSTQSALESEDGSQTLTIARVDIEFSPEGLCQTLQDSAKEQGLAKESAEVLDPVDLDGARAVHHTWSAYTEDAWYRADAYCTEDEGGTVFLLAENSEEDEPRPAPVIEPVLQEWTWT